MDSTKLSKEQQIICENHKANFRPISPDDIIGVGGGIAEGTMPINGLRHPSSEGQTGWYIWGADYSDADDFFKPVHAKHILNKYPDIAPYLGLDHGWRFLLDPTKDYIDVWYDSSLI